MGPPHIPAPHVLGLLLDLIRPQALGQLFGDEVAQGLEVAAQEGGGVWGALRGVFGLGHGRGPHMAHTEQQQRRDPQTFHGSG